MSDIYNKIENIAKKKGLSIAEVAKMSGLSPQSIYME